MHERNTRELALSIPMDIRIDNRFIGIVRLCVSMVLNEWLTIAILVLLVGGWCVLLYLVRKLQIHYNRLTHGVRSVTLTQVLDELVGQIHVLKGRTTKVEAAAVRLSSEGLGHIQRIGVVRFNPFSDTGGAQSYTIAMLDGKGDGIIMTSLYGRTGNRWYIKQVVAGKGKNIELSKEEQSAVKQASGEL